MKPSTLSRFDVDGAAGRIEVKLNDPGETRRGIALVAHPHPLFGGTNENKVVTTLARVFFEAGYVVARPNFRGVGDSAGVHDNGAGETDDLSSVMARLREHHGRLPAVLAGFSFGGFVASRLAALASAEGTPYELVVLVAPAVGRFEVGPVATSTVVIHGEDDDVVLDDDDVDSAGVPGGAVVVGVGGPGITSETTAELFSALLSVSVPVMVTLFG
jgi:alpha/beta superfamily hydrolase